MALEMIKKVKAAEEQAEALIAQAQNDAAHMRKDADTEGKDRYVAILSNAKKQGEQIMTEALAAAEEAVEKIVAQGKVQQKEILLHSQARLSDAMNLVIERIVDMNGNS